MPAYVARQRAFHAGRIVEPGEIVIADVSPGPWAEAPRKGDDAAGAPTKPVRAPKPKAGGSGAVVAPESIV